MSHKLLNIFINSTRWSSQASDGALMALKMRSHFKREGKWGERYEVKKKKISSSEFSLFLFYIEEHARGCQGGFKKKKIRKSRQMVNVPSDIKGL